MQIRYADAEMRDKILDTVIPGLKERMILDTSLKPGTCQVIYKGEFATIEFGKVSDPDNSVHS